MSREMIIYWYTTTKQFNEIEPGKTYCIGEADPDAKEYAGMSTRAAAEKRIKQELGRSSKSGAHIRFDQITDVECRLVDFPNPKNKEKSLDKDVHAVLSEIGCKQIDKEWFNTSPDEIKRVLDHIEYGSPLGTTYSLRGRQPEAIERFKKTYDSGEKRFGLFAMPRFGKTICSFEMMNYLFEQNKDKKYVFFISAKLDAEQALREDYYKFDQSCNFKLYIYGSNNKPSREQLQENKWCFFASKQWFDGKSLEDIQREFPIVNREDCIAVFFDEAHFARMTERAQRTLQILNPKMQIDITGTPFRLKSNEDYNDNNSYVYSVLDENEDYEKAEDKEKFRLNNPEMVYITPKNEFFATDSSFNQFFESDKCTEQIQKWVKSSFYGDGFNIDGKKLDITNALVVLPPRRKFCDIFYRAVTDIAKKEKLAIQCVRTSTKDDSNEDYDPDAKKVFTEWNNTCKNDKEHFHLLATIGKGLQAVSFPDCHAVIMMCDMTSPEQYIQAAFRAKTPNDHKKEAYVIDYNKGRTLQIIDTFIKNHLFVQSCDVNYKHEYERALATIQIRDHNLNRQVYTFEEIFQTFVSNWNIERITDSIDFDLDKLANKIDLSKVNIADLQKPRQLSLQLSDRGTDYEPTVDPEPDPQPVEEGGGTGGLGGDAFKEKVIEDLKRQLIMYGYIPFGGTEQDRIKPEDIDSNDIKIRELEVGQDREVRKVWSYLGGDGDLDDIYIDDSFESISLIRWRYRINSKFVNIKGEGDHGQGDKERKKLKAFVNAIIRYLPAYFLVSGKVSTFEELQERFGRQTVAENYPERQLFRNFMACGVDYRYVLDILRACDAGSREQILSFVNDKVDKCYDKAGKIIPEKVLELLWIYKKDGSRPVPKELADMMRNGKNYYIVVCGGYWLTDDTTKMYITDSFSEAEIIKLLRPNCTVIYSNDILKTLEQQKETIMKFKSFIMNPPYGNLHLPILKQMIETIVEKGGKGVSLQPVRWLQDPLKEYKQGTDYKKYKDVFDGNVKDIKTLVSMDCSKIFDALFSMDLGIFELESNNTFKLQDCYKDPLLEKILREITDGSKSHTVINDKMEKNKRQGIRVKVNDIQGNGVGEKGPSKNRIGKYKVFVSVDGLIDGKDWTECVQKNQFSKQYGSPIPYSIKFESVDEANNFVKSTETVFFQYLLIKMHKDIHVPNQWLPFMNDYSKPWTDERFYAYFNITPEEQKIIEKTVKDAKK